MYVCNFGGKGRNLTLQGNVIDVTFVERSYEKSVIYWK